MGGGGGGVRPLRTPLNPSLIHISSSKRWEKRDVFFRSTPFLFLEVHQVNCPAAQMFFLNENF